MTGDTRLEILLIEDNPGDARLIEEMLGEAEELIERIGTEQAAGETPHVHHETRLENGLAYLIGADSDEEASGDSDDDTNGGHSIERSAESEATTTDVVLLDLNLPDSTGLETLSSVLEAAPEVPVIVLTGLQDSDTGIEAISRGAQEYLVKDEVTSPMLVRTLSHAIERHEQLLERERRRQELEALNRLNRIGQEITHDVLTTSTREELEQAVCDRLAADDAYRFAWMGEVSPGGDQLVPRAVAGVEDGYLDEVTITVGNDATGQGPSGKAIQTGTIQVVQDIVTADNYGPWRESAHERGYRSSAAIPISYEGLRYGVLNVYSARADAFAEYERTLLGRLGDVVAHAITALERKEALLTDATLELEFVAEETLPELVAVTQDDGSEVRFNQFIRSNERVLAYGSASGVEQETLEDAIERIDGLSDLRVLTPGQEEYDFELTKTDGIDLFETVATHGGRVNSARIEDDSLRFVIELSQQSETAQVIETVESVCPGATFVAQRTAERSDPSIPGSSVIETKLTDRQLDALETAYRSGFFDWPRTSTGEEVAERLDISPATFTQHLRAAELKFFDAVFAGESASPGEE
ncbi:bacterio-opsin activator domain-containing protein [Natronosalvus vescus]|uniref:bacterio-opsin activator domain-containing protein n=1 Tax=Natronosalvus vescus TaxID=2953881 RepID=UPI002091966F|nr:bacterio-opsin activator domain-containing protein [Natronosalvus vescus]